MAEEKMKILYLMKILLEDTDKDHILNAIELSERMESRYALPCNRKTIYSDVERLRDFGMKIEQVKGDRQGYYVSEREFSLPELKLLVDAVQSSKFITKAKSEELIRKLEKMTSHANAGQLQRQVYIYNRPKTVNEMIFESIDLIYRAMAENRQIHFQYCMWNVKKELVPRRNGKIYEVSPWSLTWSDDNYYLVAHEDETDKIKHYRVDKMKNMGLSEKERHGRGEFRDFDLAAFAKKTFGMFGGSDQYVTLQCENWLSNVVIDRFGRDVMLVPADEGHFRVHVLVAVSNQFYAWVTGLGSGIQIVGPEAVREGYKRHLGGILERY